MPGRALWGVVCEAMTGELSQADAGRVGLGGNVRSGGLSPYVTPRQLAAVTPFCVETIIRWCKNGTLPDARKVGSGSKFHDRWCIPRAAVAAKFPELAEVDFDAPNVMPARA